MTTSTQPPEAKKSDSTGFDRLVFALAWILGGLVIGIYVVLPSLSRSGRSLGIQCVSHLKQVSLAARLYAEDHQGHFPTNWVSLKEQLPVPKVLVCPSDKHHKPAKTWERFTAKNVTYEMVSPGASVGAETNVYLRCPIHGHEAMVDGSVIQGAAFKKAPRDGNAFTSPPPSSPR
jgi:hypothetical protein